MAVCHDPVLILYKKCFTPKYLRKPTKLKSIENNFTCVHLTEACAGLSRGGGVQAVKFPLLNRWSLGTFGCAILSCRCLHQNQSPSALYNNFLCHFGANMWKFYVLAAILNISKPSSMQDSCGFITLQIG